MVDFNFVVIYVDPIQPQDYVDRVSADFSCPLGEFPCGNLSMCILQKFQCDGLEDCPNGADEAYQLCQLDVYPKQCTCKHLSYISCIDQGLTNIPEPIPANATRLVLKGNAISEINNAAFEELTNLELLFLQDNDLEDLQPGTFDGRWHTTRYESSKETLSAICIISSNSSDFLMGLYLFIIAAHDVKFRDEYMRRYARLWMDSVGCKITGVLGLLSCEVSILVLTFMSVDRFVCIVCPFGPHIVSMKHAVASMVVIWCVGLLLALLPLASVQLYGNFYGSNGICLPLHIHDPYMVGWQYSAFVFLGVNFVAFAVICVAYVGMFVSIVRTRKATTVNLDMDMSFAKRFFFIVLTDALCWIPIIITKLLAFSIDIPMELYAG
ncbi:PREDICTED: relaxin receptor 2-like [Priapulus caudatus]|uniref:Relaxin receptor 2-like n=1 Tax=Priapulus caudatus TaxID=37621 RepID=A0ABM1E9H3_PRICU|nr:PREDICTED: relaxin receptor 2-like [Priapulus caudatus]